MSDDSEGGIGTGAVAYPERTTTVLVPAPLRVTVVTEGTLVYSIGLQSHGADKHNEGAPEVVLSILSLRAQVCRVGNCRVPVGTPGDLTVLTGNICVQGTPGEQEPLANCGEEFLDAALPSHGAESCGGSILIVAEPEPPLSELAGAAT